MVLAIVFTLNSAEGESATAPSESACLAATQSMYDALSGTSIRYSDALNSANFVEQCSILHAETGRGIVAYYQREYSAAVQHFLKAFESLPTAERGDPRNDVTKKNLADSYFEAGDPEAAILYYNMISTKDALWSYKMSWAKLLQGDTVAAEALSREVPPEFNEDGNIVGRALMLKVAIILVEDSKTNHNKESINTNARRMFTEAFQKDPAVWG